jgi:hypothetical protein
VLERDSVGALGRGERLDHVAAVGEELEVGVGLARLGVAVLAEEELGVAGAGEDEVGLGEGARGARLRGLAAVHARNGKVMAQPITAPSG